MRELIEWNVRRKPVVQSKPMRPGRMSLGGETRLENLVEMLKNNGSRRQSSDGWEMPGHQDQEAPSGNIRTS